ncbi:hypothetical protein [Sphingomonas sp. PAMC 26617]|uniref:hypothetical protein n=1 Tax=Sphingomonas sp. PAMC 26617 TaxID=1112216 RepID=UPI00028A0AE9|nr:hypothetical protein [Sphingomonas sp. PAMC 26617]
MNRLFRQDRLIASNTIRATFAGWHDRAMAALMLLAALAAVRAWFVDRPWTVAAWTAFAAGAMIGMGAGRLVGTRLAFHAFDGLLAADALHRQIRRHYVAAWHGVGLGVLAVVTLIARPSLLVVSVPAYLTGVLVAALTDGLKFPTHIVGTTRPGWTLRAWSHRPITGVVAATVLLLSLLPARTLGTNALMAFVGIETVLLALILTSVDDAIVRFMTIAGHGSRHIIVRYIRGLASFLAVAASGCWVMLGPSAAGIVAAVCIAMLLIVTLRILAYRLHAKRFADLLVSILAGLLMLVAYSMPVVLPVIALAMFWQLQRRGRAKTWLLT